MTTEVILSIVAIGASLATGLIGFYVKSVSDNAKRIENTLNEKLNNIEMNLKHVYLKDEVMEMIDIKIEPAYKTLEKVESAINTLNKTLVDVQLLLEAFRHSK